MEPSELFEWNPDDPPARPRGYPKTAEEWWAFVGSYKKELRDLAGEFHPVYARWARPMKITAAGAEAASEDVREEIEERPAFTKDGHEDPLAAFDQFVSQKNAGLVHLLNETWFGVPESRDAHSLPGFGVLCDLCSESHVLEPEWGE